MHPSPSQDPGSGRLEDCPGLDRGMPCHCPNVGWSLMQVVPHGAIKDWNGAMPLFQIHFESFGVVFFAINIIEIFLSHRGFYRRPYEN